MKFEILKNRLKELPAINFDDGKIIYDFILQNKINNILELGFLHGTSTCYMAGALEELGKGNIITIDNQDTKDVKPSINQLLTELNLINYVRPIFATTSYTWELMKLIEENTKDGTCKPVLDFCFIDGAHNWETDGLAFFLADKLLKPGSWILFDDLDWTYSKSPSLKDTDFVRNMPENEKNTPQVLKVFSLLVSQHHDYKEIHVKGRWGWARKGDNNLKNNNINNIDDILYQNQRIIPDILSICRKLKRKITN